MRHFVLSNTTKYRVETIEDVESFHTELQAQATKDGYQLSSFGYKEKYVKEKGEVIDSFFEVMVTFTVNDIKEPIIPIFDVELPYNPQSMLAAKDNVSDTVVENSFE